MENELLTKKRFNELYNRSYNKHYPCFTDFLNLEEQSILAGEHLPCLCYGGYENAQRVVAGFGDNVKKQDFPIVIVKITPCMQKFADSLSHRDFLGALMNLGIKRELLGDIVIFENCGYLYCLNHIAEYITDNLTKVKHTSVNAEITSTPPSQLQQPPKPVEIIVSSLRIDAVVSAVYKLSRNQAKELFGASKIFVNSRLTENSSYNLKESDIISVRGYGRFIYENTLRTTKKDRLIISVRIY